MAEYRIKVSVSIEPVTPGSGEAGTLTTLEEIVDGNVAWSIDDCEDVVVRLGFEAMRREMSEHMENVSKGGRSSLVTGLLPPQTPIA